MDGQNRRILEDEKGYKIRCMQSLLEQIKKDHAELNRRWNKFEKGESNPIEIDCLVRVLSWVRQGLNAFNESNQRGIEGLLCGEIKDIEKDIKDKEEKLRLLLFSLSKERTVKAI